MNLIKVGTAVINLDYLISITQSCDTQLITVVTTVGSNTYDPRSSYGLLYKFLTSNSTPYKKDVVAGVNITTVYVEENGDSDNTVEQLVETGVHNNKRKLKQSQIALDTMVGDPNDESLDGNSHGIKSIEFAPGKHLRFE